MAVDKMDWHSTTFHDSIPSENAGTHIGMYLAWLINHDMIEAEWFDDFGEEFNKVKNREMTGRELLIECFDETLLEDVLTDEAIEFTSEFYDSEYLDQYADVLGDNGYTGDLAMYMYEDSWENYEKVEEMIDAAYERFADREEV
ncbi:MAG: hypothetical protein RSA86_04890 [Christensenellaceae bacterium]